MLQSPYDISASMDAENTKVEDVVKYEESSLKNIARDYIGMFKEYPMQTTCEVAGFAVIIMGLYVAAWLLFSI